MKKKKSILIKKLITQRIKVIIKIRTMDLIEVLEWFFALFHFIFGLTFYRNDTTGYMGLIEKVNDLRRIFGLPKIYPDIDKRI